MPAGACGPPLLRALVSWRTFAHASLAHFISIICYNGEILLKRFQQRLSCEDAAFAGAEAI